MRGRRNVTCSKRGRTVRGQLHELTRLCAASIFGHAATIEPDIAAAMAAHGIAAADWTAASLAVHTQAVLQGAFILAKATGDGRVARDSVDHLARYVRLLIRDRGGSTS